MRLKIWAAIAAASLWPVAAQATWLEASGEHFVIYADDNERDITPFAEQLERYHAGMARAFAINTPVPSPSNRVTIYVVKSDREVRALYGDGSKYLNGFYVPSAGGSLAIIPPVKSASGEVTLSMETLLHEYAHHFLISSNAMAMPRWFSEGAAEFFASSRFEKDGSLSLGRAAQHRAGELFYATEVSAEELLDQEQYDRKKHYSYDAFYGKSWLLYHYLTFDEARSGQLARYVQLLHAGKGERQAGLEAFGDFAALEKDLDRYLKRNRISALEFKPSMLQIGPISLRTLSAGEVSIMPVRIRSKRGVSSEDAPGLLKDAKEIAAKYPNDPAVLAALAECAYDAGDDKGAIAAADRAIAIDPKQVNAYVQKGYALFRIAETAEDRAAGFRTAREPFVALNHLENDHPLPLVYYFRSFVEQGKRPPDLAVEGLIRAVELAPFDQGLRMNLGSTLLQQGRSADARTVLSPVANDPHGGTFSEKARKMIAHIDADPQWKGQDELAPN